MASSASREEAKQPKAEAEAKERSDAASPPAEGAWKSFTPLSQEIGSWIFKHRGALGVVCLAVAVACAAAGWRIETAFATDWKEAMKQFLVPAATSTAICSGVAFSPSLNPNKKWVRWHYLRLGYLWLVLAPLWMVFGTVGPNGVVTNLAFTGFLWSLRK